MTKFSIFFAAFILTTSVSCKDKNTPKKPDTPPIENPTDGYAPLGYNLVWSDEFDETSNGLPNKDEWWYEIGGGGWGNNELEVYVPGFLGTDTVAKVKDGMLTITAYQLPSQVISVRMNTVKSWQYGYFEMRAKLPGGKGTWPAFWMMPKNFTAWPKDGEIDIMEYVGYRPDVTQSSIHCTSFYGGNSKNGTHAAPGAERNFYTYGLQWTKDSITAYINGVEYFNYPYDGKSNRDTWPFNAPFYLKLNLAIGGNWGGAQGVDPNIFPAKYVIDYVRVYQKP